MESIVIETTHLSKRYGKQLVAVDDLNLTIRKGEIYGFLGPNGAGRRRHYECCSASLALPPV